MRLFLLAILLLISSITFGSGPILSDKDLNSPPPRIIRTCCSFGSEVKLMVFPVVKITDITSIEKLGAHHYLSNPKEGNGIIYTQKGGFIDIGHLRDIADWTAFLYTKIMRNRESGSFELKLGHEGGLKTLMLNIPSDLAADDAATIAGRIAYDLSVWHEIATWFGASTVPLLPERYSSFSIEDAYSNLLGARLGIEALKSDLPYEVAMTNLIAQTLEKLIAVSSEEQTYAAMEVVRDIWWTRDKKLPSRKVLLQRQLTVYPVVSPLLIFEADSGFAVHLEVPDQVTNGQSISDFYTLNFKLNLKFPFKKIFPERKTRDITQNDFQTLLDYIQQDLEKPKYQLKDKL
jgi:hypothetical protein